MPSVTVSGASGTYVVVNYDTAAYADLATSLIGSPQTSIGTLIASGGDQVILDPATIVGIGSQSNLAGIGAVNVTDQSTALGQVILVGNGTDINLVAAQGAGTIVAGDGNDSFNVSSTSGPWDIYTGADGSQVSVGGAMGTIGGIVVMGGPDNVVLGDADETVFGSTASGGSVTGGAGYLTYVGSDGDATVTAGSGVVFGFEGAGATTFNLGSNTAVLVGNSGEMNINGSTGFTEFFGNGSQLVNFTGASDNNMFVAGSGNETLNASTATGSNVFFAGGANTVDSITGGVGSDILFGGAGDSTLTGGGDGNIFAFVDQGAGMSGANDTVTDWNSTDKLELIGGVTVASSDASSGNLVYTLSDNTEVTFDGITSIDPGSIFNF